MLLRFCINNDNNIKSHWKDKQSAINYIIMGFVDLSSIEMEEGAGFYLAEINKWGENFSKSEINVDRQLLLEIPFINCSDSKYKD